MPGRTPEPPESIHVCAYLVHHFVDKDGCIIGQEHYPVISKRYNLFSGMVEFIRALGNGELGVDKAMLIAQLLSNLLTDKKKRASRVEFRAISEMLLELSAEAGEDDI
jgi:hypothetical protein